MKRRLATFGMLLGLALTAPCPTAHAQAKPSSLSVQLADTSFVKGRALFEQGRLREAAREFEFSWRLDPSPGTLLNLGACHEGLGDMALALSTFERAAVEAKQAADPKRRQLWSEAARQRVDDLRRRVPTLVLRGLEPGSSVTLDGDALTRDGDGAELIRRVNPGRHVLRVSAPGRRSLSREFSVDEGARSTLVLPPLDVGEEPPAIPAPTPPALDDGASDSGVHAATMSAGASPHPTQREARPYGPWPLVLAGTGGALLLSGAITGWLATSKSNELREACPDDRCPESKDLEGTRDTGRSLARATDVLWVTGALCAGVGVTLFVLGSSDDDAETEVARVNQRAAALRAGCFGSHCGLTASGQF
ncbi:MAG TPA: hypothetical protein VMG12_34705 [Polyangiaceae bacterium]|nr:hypothetical protein [Polyangiaceae bacterium]